MGAPYSMLGGAHRGSYAKHFPRASAGARRGPGARLGPDPASLRAVSPFVTVESVADVAVRDSGPRILGRYAIYDAIASGGMATVHYGRLLGPVGFSRTVAIKRLHPQFAQDPEFVTMFLDEARLAARIRHPNVVGTLDVVASANEIFLVMDYVHGESLARILREVTSREQAVPLPIALRIASDSLQGLHAAHEARDERGAPLNIVHRDISPQNILLGVDGVSRLVDFGVAKAAGRGQTTREGQIKGKLSYMSPEQLKGGSTVNRQTDIHAFATVLWEMLTGRRLFAGDNEADTIARVVRHHIPPASQFTPGLPPEVDAVLMRGLAEDVRDRYATARDMCVALEACGPIAPTMLVADWVQAQAHELLERRAQTVSSIEGDQETSAPESLRSEANNRKSAAEFVAGLPSSDGSGRRSAPAIPTGSSVSVMLEDVVRPSRSRSWAGKMGVGIGVAGVAIAIFAWMGRSSTPAADRTQATSVGSQAAVAPPPVAPSVAPEIPPPPSASAAPTATAAASAPVAAPVAPAPYRGKAYPVRPKSPGATTPRHDVYDTRE